MPDKSYISQITLPSGGTYYIKDAEARDLIANLNSFEYVVSTNAATTPKDVTWQNGQSTVTGTLVASSSTVAKIYLVPSTNGTKDIYDEYITVKTGTNTYVWEMFGNTDVHMADLGDLAYKYSATGSYKPEGIVSQPTFSGSPMTSTGNFTPAGSVSAPTITVNPSTVTKYVAGSATGGGSVTPGSAPTCTLPTLNPTVVDEVLDLGWSAGSFSAGSPTQVTLPTFASQTIATGIQSASSSQPTFTGTEAEISVNGTPAGTVSQPTFTGTSKTVSVS